MDWQLLIVVAAVLGALYFLVRRAAGWLRGESGCHSCQGCSNDELVSLDVTIGKTPK